ncbi:ABC-2 type transport system permease protein [Actinopolymorpha cephalotaxi]|uniref:ABC-2 type transport system permease protein n=1 Tax=Actinopolymorpha cephalotaxi TaxID=504797 RepID=A0A1I2XBL9_9ACTN|nr:ABC-2 family transporter protein [Actinopolymorpha cephalotaxi]NYH86164.1 ABC-2 type transport system permease protein [Actinopolymorpha cephalotaxi]SFH10875.1 ABC-2 type transport system permease protein [Actinopolymorpha cephalotaxi]
MTTPVSKPTPTQVRTYADPRDPIDRTWLRRQARHLRLWRRFLSQAIVRETHYRAHFVTTLAVGVVQLGLALVPILLLYGYTDDLRGWSQAQVLTLVGVYQVVTGVLAAFVAPNLNRMTTYITEGELDVVLVRPVSSQFYLTLRWINVAELGNVASGLVLLVFGLVRSGVTPNPLEIVQALVLAACGTVLLAGVWCAMSFSAFWIQSVNPIGMLYTSLAESGRYPLVFFPFAVRTFLTFVFPVAFASTLPAQALHGGVGWLPVVGGVALTAVVVALVRAQWRRGLRSYASASS